MARSRSRERRQTGPLASIYRDALERIATNVRGLREQRGLTQEALAEAAELSTVGVALVEGARTNVTTATLCQLAYALEVDVSRLLRLGAASRQAVGRSPRNDHALAANPRKRSTRKQSE